MAQIIGYTQGTFDMFHIGHLNLLNHARKHCDYLVVGVNTDELVQRYKGKTAIVPWEERAKIVESIKGVDQVIRTDTLDKMAIWKSVHFHKIFVGDDWRGNLRWEETSRQMREIGVELIFLPYTKDTSSTLLRNKLIEY